MQLMKVLVIRPLCDRCGLCLEIAPELFGRRPGSTKAVTRRRFVPRRFGALCLAAARHCPQRAILVFTLEALVTPRRSALTREPLPSYPFGHGS